MKPLKGLGSLAGVFPGLCAWARNPAFAGWLALSAGILLGSWLFCPPVVRLYTKPVLLSMALLAAVAMVIPYRLLRLPIFFILGVGLILSALSEQRESYRELGSLRLTAPAHLWGRIISVPFFEKGEYRFAVRTDSLTDGLGTAALREKVVYCTAPDSVAPNSAICATGRFVLPSPRLNPNGFDQYTYLLSAGIFGTFRAESVQVRSIRVTPGARAQCRFRDAVLRTLDHLGNDDRRAVFEASFLGDRQSLGADLKTLFRDAGIFHLLAISGLHVGILTVFLLTALSLLPLGRSTRMVLALAAIWGYLLFVGMIPSLLRAVCMASVGLFSFMVQRRALALNSLGVAGIVLLWLSPQSLFAPGYQLSFAATLGIITIYPRFPRAMIRHPHRLARTFLSAFCVSLAGFVATLPILAYHFGTISLFGLIANVIAVVLMTAALWLFFVAVLVNLVLPSGAALLMTAADFFLQLLLGIAQPARQLPYATMAVPVPPVGLIMLYILLVLALVTVRPTLQATCMVWALAAAFAITPLVLLFQANREAVQVTFFCAKKDGLVGIRWPRQQRNWVVTTARSIPQSSVRNAITPWSRRSWQGNTGTLLFLREPRDSGWSGLAPSSILFAGLSDRRTGPGVDALQRLHTGVRIVPLSSCTCTVVAPARKDSPFGLSCRLRDTGLLISDRFDSCGAACDSAIHYARPAGSRQAFLVDVPSLLMGPDLQKRHVHHRSGETFSFNPESDGAVTIVIGNSGIARIHTMIADNHPIRAALAQAPARDTSF